MLENYICFKTLGDLVLGHSTYQNSIENYTTHYGIKERSIMIRLLILSYKK